MTRYILGRLIGSLPSVIGISIVVFALMHMLPGDPIGAMLFEYAGDPSSAEALREQLGLNDPLVVQYLRFIGGALRGDLGESLISQRSVTGEILFFLPTTLKLASMALMLAILIGVFVGSVAALMRDSWFDQAVMLISLIGVSVPIFWSGLILIQVFALWLGWLPVTGGGTGIRGLILPAFSMALAPAALIARLTRGSLLEVLPQDYIRSARAKGLRESIVVMRHAMRNALIPIITIVGLQLGALLSGTVIAETVFNVPGVGTLIINAIKQRDYMMVQGAVLYLSVLYVLLNLAVDLLYSAIDPRIRRSRA